MYGPPVKATIEHMDGVEFDRGRQKMEMQALLFTYEINEIVRTTTDSTALLVESDQGVTGICVASPTSWKQFKNNQVCIRKFADVAYGESIQRENAFNRILAKIQKLGKFSYMKYEFFELPELSNGLHYSTCVWNDDGEPHELEPSVEIGHGSKSNLNFYLVCMTYSC